MYYSKQKVEQQLEEGIDNPVDIVEDLHEWISKMVEEMRGRQLEVEMQDFIEEWEGEE